MIHSFLLIGQSNMAGRGFFKEVPAIFDEGIKMLRNGRWQIMSEPVHYDLPVAGVGLAASFAGAWRLNNERDEIGLIPGADGGTSLDDWSVGSVLFDHAVAQAKMAQRTSQLAGILWHQGESDCSSSLAAIYPVKLDVVIRAFRCQLDLPTIPFIVGGLGDFLTTGLYGSYFSAYPLINEALLQYARVTEHCYYATAAGLSANQDQIHFNAESQRILGVRYFEAFNTRRHITTPLVHEHDILKAIYERPPTQKEKKTLLEYRFVSGEITQQEFQEQTAVL